MSSFIFNDFKKRYLNGEVPSADNWTFIPVTDSFKKHFEFDDIKLEQYRSLSDFNDVSVAKQTPYLTYTGNEKEISKNKERYVDVLNNNFRLLGSDLINGTPLTFRWTKVIDDAEFNNKPMFVTNDNITKFNSYYSDSIKNNPYINTYLALGGFYYIHSKDELEWFANHVEKNNVIIGVIGDTIEGTLSKPIGTEQHPFNGTLDGNFYTFKNISIKAQTTDNGIVGVLGPFGVVRNIKLVNEDNTVNSIQCETAINLTHIRNDGRDINCGLIVGRNYGIVENIDATNLGTFNIYGCVPSVYSVTNKSDKYKWNENENIIRDKFDSGNDNFLYLNSFCINSPGNICPYVGYFNEGKFADDTLAVLLDTNHTTLTSTYADDTEFDWKYVFGNCGHSYFPSEIASHNLDLGFSAWVDTNNKVALRYMPMGSFYAYGDQSKAFRPKITDYLNNDYLESNYALKSYIKNPIYYGLDSNGFYTTRVVGHYDLSQIQTTSQTWVENYNSNLCQKVLGNSGYRDKGELKPNYEMTRVSLRSHPQSRAAYNVGTIIGANFGTAQNIQVSAIIKNTSNFVGFIGGLAGKQANGFINNVSVYMDNEFIYDFGGKPELGDIAFYKQTPIFPSVVKDYLESTLPDSWERNKIVNLYCKTWYDNTREDADTLPKKVVTATTITDDVMAYRLRPIFVAGGLFGRYIPTYGFQRNIYTSLTETLGCTVNNSTVIYKDNFSTDTAIKRAETSLGAVIGKVDYATTTNNIYLNDSIILNNCFFSAISNVGEPFKVFANHFEDGIGFVPDTSANATDPTRFSLISATESKPVVGIFEVKHNVLDTVSYDVNKALGYMPQTTFDTSKKSLTDVGIYWGSDYPIELSSHHGGIERTHNMWSFTTAYYPNDPDTQYYKLSNNTVAVGTWDVLNKYYMNPNIDSIGRGGFNKRNVAQQLIGMNNCWGNLSNWINLYDDYMNTWNYMKMPHNVAGSDISDTDITNNSFSQAGIYLLTKYWNKYRTNSNTVVNDAATELKKAVNWDDTQATWSTNSGVLTEGLLNYQIDATVSNGTQNTFDGYTTFEFKHPGIYHTINGTYLDGLNAPGPATNFSAWQLNCCTIDHCNDNKVIKKNISQQFNYHWFINPIETINFDLSKVSVFPPRNNDDSYYYYTYSGIQGTQNNTLVNNKIKDVFGFTIPVTFSSYNSHDMGYYSPKTIDELNKDIPTSITLGQYLPPATIRKYISNSKLVDASGRTYFETTGLSSNYALGGLLVVDSSGRNVMFMENENNIAITGNAVSFVCRSPKYDGTNKLILSVE